MRKLIASVLAMFVWWCGKAQDVAALQAKYAGEQAVIVSASEAYKIAFKDGKPLVESSENLQLLFLSSGNPSYLGRYKFHHSSFHDIKNYAAYTQTPDKRKLKVTEFKTSHSQSSGVFYDDVKETSFDFPGISPGAVGNFEASYTHKNIALLSPYYFKRGVPVATSKLVISFPDRISVKYMLRGQDTSVIKVRQVKKRGETTLTFEASGLEAEKRYGDAPGASYYSPHVVFFIEKYVNDGGEVIKNLGTVDDLYALNYSFIKDLNRQPDDNVKAIVKEVTGSLSAPVDKAKAIYQWVQKNIKYVAFEDGMGGFIPRDGNLVCSRKYGDCKDMSSVITLMLTAAGVPSYLTWIGTRSLAYDYTDVPLPIADNHMIAAIDDGNGGYIFLDGTDSHCLFGKPPYPIQGKQALIAISPTEYKVVRVPVMQKENNQLTDSAFIYLSEKGILGSIKIDLEGYFATDTRAEQQYVSGKDNETFMRALMSRGSNKFLLDKFDAPHLQNAGRVSYTGSFKLDDYARKIGEDWYINMNLLKLYEHQEIDHPKRKIPVAFDFPFRKKFVTVLQIPDDYKVNHVPQSKSFSNKVWGFEMTYAQTGQNVILTLEFANDHLLLQPEDFAQWNEVLTHLLPLYKETITVSKK